MTVEPLASQAFGRVHVRAVELCVVRQFARLHDAGVELLPDGIAALDPMTAPAARDHVRSGSRATSVSDQ